MDPELQFLIASAYARSKTSSIDLFQTLLEVSMLTGWEPALAALEGCVIQRRLGWWQQYQSTFATCGDPCRDAYWVFYETYLGASAPRDGEIVSATPGRWVTRWWNPCPTLVACQHFGLDTRQVCRLVYERPVQELFTRIHPGLRFRRDYTAIRPYTPYCEEVIELEYG
jgi:hypothetical protein